MCCVTPNPNETRTGEEINKALQMVCETAYLASEGFWFMFLSIIALVAFVVPAATTAAVAKTPSLAVTVKKSQAVSGAVNIMDKFSRLTIG